MSLKVDLLETSFAHVRERQTDFSDYFYTTLFADYPEVEPLFANTHMDEQSKKLFASLVLLIETLRDPNALTQSLQGLGTRHVKYGVLPDHYPMVGATLLKALSFILQEKWTPDVEQAWTDAYAVITTVMLDGADYPEEILNPQVLVATDSV